MTSPGTITRSVESRDPSLSPEANELLTEQLRLVIGTDSVDVPETWPDHRTDRHATHSSFAASAILLRFFIAIVALMLAMTALIGIIATTSSWVLTGVATVLFLPAVYIIASMVFRMYEEPEHMDPEVAAVLSAEGMGDPDATFTNLVHDFQPPPARSGMTAASPS